MSAWRVVMIEDISIVLVSVEVDEMSIDMAWTATSPGTPTLSQIGTPPAEHVAKTEHQIADRRSVGRLFWSFVKLAFDSRPLSMTRALTIANVTGVMAVTSISGGRPRSQFHISGRQVRNPRRKPSVVCIYRDF